MKKSACPTMEQLLALIAGDSVGDEPILREHLETCVSCRHLIDAAKTPVTPAMIASTDRYRRLIATPPPASLEVGQIWRVRTSPEHARLAVLTATPRPTAGITGEVVRVSPIRYREEGMHLSDQEAVLEETDSPLEKWALVEVFSDVPVCRDELEVFFGQVASAAWTRIHDSLSQTALSKNLPPKVAMFRSRCIREALPLAHKAMNSYATCVSPQTVIWEGTLSPAGEEHRLPLAASSDGDDGLAKFHRALVRLQLEADTPPFEIIPAVQGQTFSLVNLPGKALEIVPREGRSEFFPILDGRVTFEFLPHCLTGTHLVTLRIHP